MAMPEPTPVNRDPRKTRLAALALVSAMARQDTDTAMVIIRENDAFALIPEMASLAIRCLLTAQGYDVQTVTRILDQWMREVA